MTEWADQFNTIWHCDFEFREDANHHPEPVCCYAYEQHTGQEIELWQDDLCARRAAPFDTGPRSLVVAYAANAELSCFLKLDWPFPINVLDAYVETCAAINGNTVIWPQKKRPKLPEALRLFGLEGMSVETKEKMRDLILHNTDYTRQQKRDIQNYNRRDVVDEVALLKCLSPKIDFPHGLMRGRFMASVACTEWCGLPIDCTYLNQLLENWERLQLHYIEQLDDFSLYDGLHFRDARLQTLIDSRGWDWPRTEQGRLETKVKTFGKQAKRYPELKNLVKLREQIAELRISSLANTVGADGFSRCPLLPFWTVTGRNQPSARDKIFLPALPAWLHGLVRPPRGWGIAELDWDGQEIAIMAALSGDPVMISDYESGDPHLQFAKRAKLVPEDASKHEYREIRDKICKPVVLGQNYGMSPFGIAAKTKKSLLWAREIHARHRLIYPVFHRWLDDTVAQAKFDCVIESPFGWPRAVTADTKTRSLMNYMAQAGGADMMRIAMIAATEAGIKICAPIHDAFWVMAPLVELDSTIERMKDIMLRAGEAVTGGLRVGVSVEKIVRWPNCFGDVRAPNDKGQAMWDEIRSLIPQLQQKAGG
jgi:hypothetical protein